MSKKKAKRTALRRRNRAPRERAAQPGQILDALNAARKPLTPDELAARLHVARHARRDFDRALAELERAGDVVQNRAGRLLVAKRIALVAGRIEGHPDGHGFLVPEDASASIFLPAAEMRQLMMNAEALAAVASYQEAASRYASSTNLALRRILRQDLARISRRPCGLARSPEAQLTETFVRNGVHRRTAQVLIEALKHYGAIVVERSASPTLYAQRNAKWRKVLPDNVLQDINLRNFEVLQLPEVLNDPGSFTELGSQAAHREQQRDLGSRPGVGCRAAADLGDEPALVPGHVEIDGAWTAVARDREHVGSGASLRDRLSEPMQDVDVHRVASSCVQQ